MPEKEDLIKLMDEPDEIVKKFKEIISQIKENNLREGIRIDFSGDTAFQIYPEGIFAITDYGNKQISEEDAIAFLYDQYFLSGGLENIMTAVQLLKTKKSYDLGKRILLISSGEHDATIRLINKIV